LTIAHHGQGGPTLYAAKEAAEILRVKKSWLERQAAARKIPFTMLDGAYRFTVVHLVAIVQMHEQAPDPLTEIRDRDTCVRHWPVRRDPRRLLRGHVEPTATIGLMAAARMLGISPDEASDLAGRREFPCNVIETGDCYRVPFAALLRVLDPGPVRHDGQDTTP
jgi:hypothetical protein